MRELIITNDVKLLILDSISALITKFNGLPLKEMLSDLLLEVGGFRCDTSLIVLNEHEGHEVVESLSPFIAKSIVL